MTRQSTDPPRFDHRCLGEPSIMAEFTGRLHNAPVVYVLAQIRFSAVLKMAEYVPAIQEELRPNYPRYENQQIATIEIGSPGASATPTIANRWVFKDKDQQFGFILEQSAMVFHTSNYVDFPDFRDRLLEGVTIVQKIVNIPLIERVGLRYIDLITPADDEAIDRYVKPELLGFSLTDLGLKTEMNQQLISGKTKTGQLLVRFTKARHTSPLPLDLSPTALQLKRVPKSTKESAIMDTDHFAEKSIDFDVGQLTKLIGELQSPIGSVFKAAITDYAVEQWR